jgi:hypothetical protein
MPEVMSHKRRRNQEGNHGDWRDLRIDTQHQSETADDLDRSGCQHEQRHKCSRGSMLGEFLCRETLWDDAKTVGEKYQGNQNTGCGERVTLK